MVEKAASAFLRPDLAWNSVWDLKRHAKKLPSFAEVHPGERPIATELNPKQALCLTEIALNDRF